jgi:N-acetylneuraminate synthase/N,N'-diacetyllegionaminate synthase
MISIAGRAIGSKESPFVIAEAGINHNGRLDMAIKLIDVAVAAGADAVKFQTFKVERLNCSSTPKAPYQRADRKDFENQSQMLKRVELSEKQHKVLQKHARKRGICFLSTPFDSESLRFLASLNLPAFKISSCDLTNLPFLKEVAHLMKPIVLSTGMGTLAEIKQAVAAVRGAGNKRLVLLQCVSCYPAAASLLNLKTIPMLAQVTKCPIGFSDHSAGLGAAAAATALGACVIEKHITLDRNLPGPDHRSSLEPKAFRQFIEAVRDAYASLGKAQKICLPEEIPVARVARKSIVSRVRINKGTIIKSDLLDIKRPGTGLSPALFFKILGRKARQTIPADRPIQKGMV